MSLWEAVAWLGNACYFSRFLWQWLASEKAKRVVVPKAFWWLSTTGVVCYGLYSAWLREPVLLAGALINLLIYLRNLALAHGRVRAFLNPLAASAIALVATAAMVVTGILKPREDLTRAPSWLAISIVGQAFWSSRFILQWWWAERHRRSGFPIAFWWASLVGNALLLSYALHLGEPPLIAALALGPIVQVRNLMLASGTVSSGVNDSRTGLPGVGASPGAGKTAVGRSLR